jgi:hypothetical protein
LNIVEFAGLPGAGKTTLCRALGVRARALGLVFEESTDVIASRHALRRMSSKLALVVLDILINPRQCFRRFRRCMLLRPGFDPRKWSAIFNWLYMCALYRRAGRRQTRQLLDQGLWQAVWSIFFRWRAEGADVLVHDLIRAELSGLRGMRHSIVVIHSSASRVGQRLLSRREGRSPLDGHRNPDMQGATHALSQTLALLRQASVEFSRLAVLDVRVEDLDPTTVERTTVLLQGILEQRN